MFIILALLFTLTTPAQALDQRSHAGRPRLDASDQIKLNHVVIDAYIEFFNSHVRSGRDLESILLPHLKDPRDAKKILSELGPAPRLSREGNDIILELGKNKVRLKWPNLAQGQVYVEGVSWTFDRSAPFAPQIEDLKNRLKNSSSKNASIVDWLLPEAHAFFPGAVAACTASTLCTWVVAFVGTQLVTNTPYVIENISCWALSPLHPWEHMMICRNWKNSLDALAKDSSTGLIQTAEKDPKLRWIDGPGHQCSEGKDEGFQSWMAAVRLQPDGKWQDESWFRFIAKSKDGRFTEAAVFDNSTDERAPEKALVKFTFYDNGGAKDAPVIKTIAFRRKGTTDKVTDSTFLTIRDSDKAEAVPIEYRDNVGRMVSLALSAQTWSDTCHNEKFANQFKREKEQQVETSYSTGEPPLPPFPSPAPTSK